jgi:putative glutathione S-transferase
MLRRLVGEDAKALRPWRFRTDRRPGVDGFVESAPPATVALPGDSLASAVSELFGGSVVGGRVTGASVTGANVADGPTSGGPMSGPALVDVPSGQVVTNDFAQMTLDLSTQWTAHHRDGAPDLFPEPRREEILEVADSFHEDVNNGVYKCGFAGRQASYERAYHTLFARLDDLTERLSTRRYLVGDTITEADIRLFTTLARFDAVYHGHFKANRSKHTEMPVLWAYARDLFQTSGFGDTQDFVQIKQHYYGTHRDINPAGIVPLGPDERVWASPHHREELGGRPFGEGTAPGPVSPSEAVPAENNRALELLGLSHR